MDTNIFRGNVSRERLKRVLDQAPNFLKDWRKDGMDLLQYAVKEGHERVVNMLFDLGWVDEDKRAAYNVNSEIMMDHEECTVASLLQYAARSCKLDIVKLLIDEGADLHQRASDGCTIMEWFDREGDSRHIHVKQLIDSILVKRHAQSTQKFVKLVPSFHDLSFLLTDKKPLFPFDFSIKLKDHTYVECHSRILKQRSNLFRMIRRKAVVFDTISSEEMNCILLCIYKARCFEDIIGAQILRFVELVILFGLDWLEDDLSYCLLHRHMFYESNALDLYAVGFNSRTLWLKKCIVFIFATKELSLHKTLDEAQNIANGDKAIMEKYHLYLWDFIKCYEGESSESVRKRGRIKNLDVKPEPERKRGKIFTDVEGLLSKKEPVFPFDFKIILKNKDNNESSMFECHSRILKERSSYFDGLLSSGMAESTLGQVVFDAFSPCELKWILASIYKGKPFDDSFGGNLLRYIELTCFFGLEWLMEDLCKWMAVHEVIDESNVFLLYGAAIDYGYNRLKDMVNNFVTKSDLLKILNGAEKLAKRDKTEMVKYRAYFWDLVKNSRKFGWQIDFVSRYYLAHKQEAAVIMIIDKK